MLNSRNKITIAINVQKVKYIDEKSFYSRSQFRNLFFGLNDQAILLETNTLKENT